MSVQLKEKQAVYALMCERHGTVVELTEVALRGCAHSTSREKWMLWLRMCILWQHYTSVNAWTTTINFGLCLLQDCTALSPLTLKCNQKGGIFSLFIQSVAVFRIWLVEQRSKSDEREYRSMSFWLFASLSVCSRQAVLCWLNALVVLIFQWPFLEVRPVGGRKRFLWVSLWIIHWTDSFKTPIHWATNNTLCVSHRRATVNTDLAEQK